MELSLRLSGIIRDGDYNTGLFITTGLSYPELFSLEDMFDVIDRMFKQIVKVNKEMKVDKLSLKCINEFEDGTKFVKNTIEKNVFPLFRIFLNSQHGNKGRTYLVLDAIEIAKVRILDENENEIKIVSKISNMELKDKLNNLHTVFLRYYT